MVEEAGADCLIGIINAYPTGIGKEETVLSIFGREAAWQEWSEPLRALGGRSAHAGTEPGMAAALFAALIVVSTLGFVACQPKTVVVEKVETKVVEDARPHASRDLVEAREDVLGAGLSGGDSGLEEDAERVTGQTQRASPCAACSRSFLGSRPARWGCGAP